MSAQPVVHPDVRATPGSRPPQRRPRLRLVPPPRPRMGRTPFLVLLIGLVGAGMVGLLILNTHLQNQAFAASQLRRQAAEMSYAEGELRQLVIEAGSTGELTRKATELGMRPNREIAFVELPSGQIAGEPAASDGLFLPSALTKSPEQLAKERAERAEQRAAERRAQEERILNGHRQRILDARAAEMAAAQEARGGDPAAAPGEGSSATVPTPTVPQTRTQDTADQGDRSQSDRSQGADSEGEATTGEQNPFPPRPAAWARNATTQTGSR